jgi:excisionase family DNA binding protein
MDKKQAAEFLGCSPRQLERYVKENRIGVTLTARQGKRPTPVFDEGELQRFKEAQARPMYKPAIERAGTMATPGDSDDNALSLLPTAPQMDALSRLFDAFAARHATAQPETPQRPLVPVADKLLLTVQEAAELAGLSSGAIRAAIKQSTLPALRGNWRGWRIRRGELEEFTNGL